MVRDKFAPISKNQIMYKRAGNYSRSNAQRGALQSRENSTKNAERIIQKGLKSDHEYESMTKIGNICELKHILKGKNKNELEYQNKQSLINYQELTSKQIKKSLSYFNKNDWCVKPYTNYKKIL